MYLIKELLIPKSTKLKKPVITLIIAQIPKSSLPILFIMYGVRNKPTITVHIRPKTLNLVFLITFCDRDCVLGFNLNVNAIS